MVTLICTERALHDLDGIADYIALDNPVAARELVQRVFEHVEQLQAHPESGSIPADLRQFSRRYRQIVESPCRVFYRYDRRNKRIFLLHVMRAEMRLPKSQIVKRSPQS